MTSLGKQEDQADRYYRAAITTLINATAAVAHAEKEIAARASKIKTLDGEIASLERTIKACDEWLKYHPDATPSEKRKNADAKSRAQQSRDEKKSRRSELNTVKLQYQASLIGKRLSLMTAKSSHNSRKKSYDQAKNAHDKVKREIAWKKAERARKEHDRAKKRETLRELERQRDAASNNNDG